MDNKKVLKDFLETPYDELEILNLRVAEQSEKMSVAELRKQLGHG